MFCNLLSKSTGEDEEETGEDAAKITKRTSLGAGDTYIEIPRSEQLQPVTCFLEKPGIDKKVKRHSIHGMMEEENVIRPHQEIAQLSLDEKKFLLAVERGDVASTRRMLQRAEETSYININCVDPLGRSALLMAIDNENLEMVELLIEHRVETKDALLHAISEEFVEAVEVLLDHEETIHKIGEPHSWEALPPDTATFTPDITPLILSAHRDNYEIIKILLDRGATLPMPHDVRCGCDECVTSRMEDSLRHSRSRINAYRALASPSLIALSSKDPILTAFELSWELRRLSFMEHEFKIEYQELRKQCQDFATALLDHTRSSYELEVLLNHDPTGPAFEHGERMHLNRLKLAVKLRQKKVQIMKYLLLLQIFLLVSIVAINSVNGKKVYGNGARDVTRDEYEYVMANLDKLDSAIQAGNRNFDKLVQILEKVFPQLFRTSARLFNGYTRKLLCTVSSYLLQSVIGAKRSGTSKEELSTILKNICVTLQIEPSNVCVGAIDLNLDILAYIIDNTPALDGQLAAAVILQSFGCKSPKLTEWTIDLPPKATKSKHQRNSRSDETFNVLQITDIHYDPAYTIGNLAKCKEPMCCKQDNGVASTPEEAAQRWGDYRKCDLSLEMIQDAFTQASKHDYDYVYFTGDIISHKVWDTSVDSNRDHIQTIMKEFRDKFDKPVYPILGNHEPQPVNVFVPRNVSPAFVSTEWVMKLAAEEWSAWLPEETKETILKGGYYTVSPRPGFRIVAINSNVCFTYNWWIMHENSDTYGQLDWLVSTLAEAERNNEAVHLLSHVPTGDDTCLKVWSRNLRNIIRRFSTTITAVFNGHTHDDQFIVYYDEDNVNSIAVAYNGGSLTTYSDNNPNYRLYNVDAGNFEVTDYEQWIYNLTEANLNADENPNWFKLYSFKDAYKMDNLQPASFAELLNRMAGSYQLMEQYHRFVSREADSALAKHCGDTCLKDHLCSLSTTYYEDTAKCSEHLSMWDNRL